MKQGKMKRTHIILCFILHIYMCFEQHAIAQIRGCTDPLSQNYNPNATVNDGSCLYAKTKVTQRAFHGEGDDEV